MIVNHLLKFYKVNNNLYHLSLYYIYIKKARIVKKHLINSYT